MWSHIKLPCNSKRHTLTFFKTVGFVIVVMIVIIFKKIFFDSEVRVEAFKKVFMGKIKYQKKKLNWENYRWFRET